MPLSTCCQKTIYEEEAILNHGMCNECDGKLYKQLPVIEPQHDTAEHKKAMLNEREKAMALFMRGKYKEVVELVDSIYGWAPGELEEEFGHPREYTKESALKAMQSL